MKLHKLVISSMLIAIGTLLSQWIKFPVGPAICAPIQHLVNVIGAVILGPWYAVFNALIISMLRNLLGTGTLLAFPGSLFGALLGGLLYKRFKSIKFAVIGEVVGVGIIGSILAFPVAKLIMGKSVGALFFMPSFLISSIVGAIMAALILPALKKSMMFK